MCLAVWAQQAFGDWMRPPSWAIGHTSINMSPGSDGLKIGYPAPVVRRTGIKWCYVCVPQRPHGSDVDRPINELPPPHGTMWRKGHMHNNLLTSINTNNLGIMYLWLGWYKRRKVHRRRGVLLTDVIGSTIKLCEQASHINMNITF